MCVRVDTLPNHPKSVNTKSLLFSRQRCGLHDNARPLTPYHLALSPCQVCHASKSPSKFCSRLFFEVLDIYSFCLCACSTQSQTDTNTWSVNDLFTKNTCVSSKITSCVTASHKRWHSGTESDRRQLALFLPFHCLITHVRTNSHFGHISLWTHYEHYSAIIIMPL